MAVSNHAPLPSPPESSGADSPIPPAAPKPAPPQNDSESLALQTDESIDSIRNVHCVYACLEKLILPQRVTDDEDMHPTRSELGALVGLVNEELQRRIDAADATIKSLRGALRESDVQ